MVHTRCTVQDKERDRIVMIENIFVTFNVRNTHGIFLLYAHPFLTIQNRLLDCEK